MVSGPEAHPLFNALKLGIIFALFKLLAFSALGKFASMTCLSVSGLVRGA